jgi:hypothetical protein
METALIISPFCFISRLSLNQREFHHGGIGGTEEAKDKKAFQNSLSLCLRVSVVDFFIIIHSLSPEE